MSGHIWLFVWSLYGIFVETKRSFKSASFCTDSSRTSRLSIFTVYFCSLQYYYCCNKLLVFMCFFSMNNNILLQLGLGVTSPQRSFGVRLSRIHSSPTEKCPWGRHEYATNEPQGTSAGRQGLGVDVQKSPWSFGLFAA